MIEVATQDRQALLQRSFANAILSDGAPIPATIQLASGPATTSRFGIYRNNVLSSLINALAARYPISRKILWPDTFEGAARLFMTRHPPRSPMLFDYGSDFPQFLRSIGNGPAVEYVADIAELESARVRAYHASDAAPLPREALATLSPDTRLELHPSLSLVRSRFPIVSLWEAAQENRDADRWNAEAALIVRPFLNVQVWRLPPGGYAFFSAIAGGRTVGNAAAEAMVSTTQFDLAAIFNVMICAEAVTGMAAPH
ncbi:MAG: DNA-binding domain-containing protein [Pseudorhodoplanes sp.]